MGRRSIHTADELKELILVAATELIERDGLAGLSAREIARRIGYSPGTLYNVFENLDALVLTIEARLLDRLAARLGELPHQETPEARVLALARAYLAFTHENPKLWNLLFEHHMPAGKAVPSWYQTKLDGLMTRIEEAVAPLVDTRDPIAPKRAARVLWSGVHGITSLSTADKLSNITAESAAPLVEDLVSTYLAGLKHQHRA
ncbi:MAG: TetR/AcrR family transcriptional regulator [Hyphomicrobium sp.]|nr:TetR/AcrR family transcriptional regulator [Hyphomicrobium sp.]